MASLDLLTKRKPGRCGDPEWHGQAFDISDARIPEAIRTMAAKDYRPGHSLFFCDTDQGGEWWLMDGDQFVEAYWLK